MKDLITQVISELNVENQSGAAGVAKGCRAALDRHRAAPHGRRLHGRGRRADGGDQPVPRAHIDQGD